MMKNIGYKALVTAAFLLLAGSVLGIAWALYAYYDYQQYVKKLNYTMSGDTAIVQAVDSEAGTCSLSADNRRVLYTFLTDSTGKRVKSADTAQTGHSISFRAESVLGSAEGTIYETDSDYVCVELSSDGKSWRYYFMNRADYDDYRKAVSPEGWVKPNLTP